MELALYPFKVLKERAASLLIALIPLVFLLGATMYGAEKPSFETIKSTVDYQFGSNASFAASELTQYAQIGANGLPPIIRLGGITKSVTVTSVQTALAKLSAGAISPELVSLVIVFVTMFLAYLAYALISGIVLNLKNNKPAGLGLNGINPNSILLCLAAAAVVLFFAALSLKGFELFLLLNLGLPFTFMIPIAASGEKLGGCIFKSVDFLRFNMGGIVTLYLLCMGVAVAAQIGLLVVFMFPLSVLDKSIAPGLEVLLSIIGIAFALFYQYVVCARSVLDFNRKTIIKVPSLRTKIGRKVRK